MNDRELLEYAAKAAEYDYQWDDKILFVFQNGFWNEWNPLTDDGDALRLAVKLQSQECIGNWIDKYFNAAEYIKDPYAATRRAIVRAAAEIGKAMP